jgi:hypothetical protein
MNWSSLEKGEHQEKVVDHHRRLPIKRVIVFVLAVFWVWNILGESQVSKINGSAENVVAHLKNLQKIASEHGESRSVINGHLASVQYVVDEISRYNSTWKVWTQDVPVQVQVDEYPPFFSVKASSKKRVFTPRVEVATARGSGSQKFTGSAKIPDGCDFEISSSSWAAVIDSTVTTTSCTPCDRAIRAIELGAKGLIFISQPGNQAGYPHSMPPNPGRCGRNPEIAAIFGKVAVVSLGDAAAFEFLSFFGSHPDMELEFDVKSSLTTFTSKNVLADTRAGNPDQVVLFGSHLDGVPAGPGINDDGSGAMGTLELARALAESSLNGKNIPTIRLAFWAAEEIGLVGSQFYVADLYKHNPEELKRIKLSIDTDMIGFF